jgi:hypothetical protein
MKDEFLAYTQTISLSTTLTAKVRSVFDFYSTICPEEIKWIHISDYFTQEGERVYEAVYLFSDNFAMEAKEFASREDFDLAPIELISYLGIKKQDYDLKQATEKSRLTLFFHFSEKAYVEMKASKENCDNLWSLFREYVLPRTMGKK